MNNSPIWKGLIRTRDDVIRGLDLLVMHGSPPDFSSLIGGNVIIQSGRVYDVLRHRSAQVDWGPITLSKGQCRRWCFILWMAVRGKMALRSRLFSASVIDSSECVLCNGASETEEHLWFQCPYIRDVADRVLDWAGICHREASLQNWLQWFGQDPRPGSFMF